MKLGHDRIVAITGWNCSGGRLILTRPDLTTNFEDLRHLIDALDSSDLTIAESRVLLPQVYRMIGTTHEAGAMGPGVDLESRELHRCRSTGGKVDYSCHRAG